MTLSETDNTAAGTGWTRPCPRCRYDTTGLPATPCPECGLTTTVAGEIWESLDIQSSQRSMLLASGNVVSLLIYVPASTLTHSASRRLDTSDAFWLITLASALGAGIGISLINLQRHKRNQPLLPWLCHIGLLLVIILLATIR